jgi:hypothetical protein
MSLLESLDRLPVKKHVASIEVNGWVSWILIQSIIKVFQSLLQLLIVVISKTPIVIMDTSRLFCKVTLDSFAITLQCLFIHIVFKVGKAKVVVH